jgi:polyisoprenoid-binding protein YceI
VIGLIMVGMLVAACSGAVPAPANTPAPVQIAPAAPVEAAPTADAAADAGADAATDREVRSFTIDPTQSLARFTLTEELMGVPTTVVGESNGVAGGIEINFADYRQTKILPLQIDASAFTTDNNFRNRAIRRFILQSEQPQYQYITFTPTAVAGLPTEAAVGDTFEFTVEGDLTIREVTQPVDFVVSVTPLSATELAGKARTTVLWADFDLQIPDVPSVANVSDDVLLEFDFVATVP